MYQGVIDKEVWPNFTIDPQNADELSKLYTDLMSLVNPYRAGAIIGEKNFTSDWEKLQSDLKSAGLERFLEIQQEYWDTYVDNWASH